MHKSFFVLIIFISLSVGLLAKSTDEIPIVDSLEKIVLESQNPEILIKSASKLCWILRSRNPELAATYGNKALRLIKKNPQYEYQKPRLLNYLGVVSRNKGDYNNAMNYYFEALESAEKTNNNEQIAYSHNNLGGIFILKGDYIDAIEYLKKALHYFSADSNYSGMGYTCINLGNLYRHTGEITEGIKCFDEALVYKKKVNDTIGAAVTINLKAIALYDNGQYTEAYNLFVELQSLYENNKDIKGFSIIKNYLGLIETQNGNYQKAILYFQESIKICEETSYKQGTALAHISIAIPYQQTAQNNLAFSALKKGTLISREIGDLELITNSYKNYAEIYYNLKSYKLAYEYRLKYQNTLKRHLDNLTLERIATLRINTELEKKKNYTDNLEKRAELLEENVSLNEEKLRLQMYFVVSLVLIILLILIPLFVLIRKNKNKLSRNEELISKNIQLQESNKTRERFLSIIGHDLKNPFNSVLGLTSLVIDEWDSLPDTEKLYILNEVHGSSNSIYELMDNLLLWAKNQSDSIKVHPEQFDISENIIDVYEIYRNQASFKNVNIEISIGSNNFVFADPNMINTILRNLLSNAVKFTRKGGNIIIELKKSSKEIEVSISDNGKGIPPEDLKKIIDDRNDYSTKGTSDESGTGLGLIVVRDFVKKNNGVFWIESKVGKGSKFCFTLPDHL